MPLLRSGIALRVALGLVLAADTLSIAVMETVDNAVMAGIPGAMDSGLINTVFWIGMIVALAAAFVAAFPVNHYLLARGKGHALTHQLHEGHSGHAGHGVGMETKLLLAGLVGFLLGGLTVWVAAELEDEPAPRHGAAGVDWSLDCLMGDKAWYLPTWLDRILPNVDVEGESLLRYRQSQADRELVNA